MFSQDTLNKDLIRVFFHETGHFVAKELNLRRNKGSGTRAIEIAPDSRSRGYYEGWTHSIVPGGSQEEAIAPPERFAENLASLVYGCMFQSYYLKSNLGECFAQKGGGYEDSGKWASGLRHYGFDNQEVSIIEYDFFELLVQNNGLEQVMKLNPLDYLKETSKKDHFTVDLDTLRIDLSDFLTAHLPVYETLISGYNSIFNRNPGFGS